jgi:alpha-glucosidase
VRALPGPDTPHHDGSELYVTDPDPGPDEEVTVFLRVPHGAGISAVALRHVVDGEPQLVEAVEDRSDEVDTWWRAAFTVRNQVVPYRFLTDGGPSGHRWVTAAGAVDADPTDAEDFRLTTFDPPPAWAADAIYYQVFPDRFARSGAPTPWPDWALPANWDDPVVRGGDDAMRQLYGGDLPGLQARLDHLEDLGVNAIYLNPFFPARSNHRYNASSFATVDPVLGGDEALAELLGQLHLRGMHLVGDFTPNHCGDDHPWFQAARADADSEEATFFTFHDHPDDYEAWWGVPTLPEFDYTSAELRRRVYADRGSVIDTWLSPPYGMDGWRIDVANNVGRHGQVDDNREVAVGIRRAVQRANPAGLLIAEHGHDASLDLLGDGWHGTMHYAGFTSPVRSWLIDPSHDATSLTGDPVGLPRLPGSVAAETMLRFRAAVPWRTTLHNWNLLSSHDTSRFRTVAGSSEAALVGAGLLLTMPGTPVIFAGDELGLEGRDHEEARQPMPWSAPDRWDRHLHDGYRQLVRLRRDCRALRRGGFRWLAADDDQLVYLRELPDEVILIRVVRTAVGPSTLRPGVLGPAGEAEHLLGGAPLRRGLDGTALPATAGPTVDVWRI